MVIDKFENYRLYSQLTKRLGKGFEFLASTDLKTLAIGTHEIDADKIFAIVQEYDTKDESECVLEGHHKYIDIQYVISGVELMGFAPLTNQKMVEEDLEKDYTFYEGDTSLLRVEEGMFTLFFPEDLHRTCVKVTDISKVKKVVVKVKI
ncbi:MAG: YhcH/YjgK/YiaL family protein [Flavobacterium sp.]